MSIIDRQNVIEWIGSKKVRWLLHVVFWLAVLGFYTAFFGQRNVNYHITLAFVAILLPVTIITTYFLNYELIPKYLLQKRYARFFLYFVYTLIVSFYIEMMTVIIIFLSVAELNMSEFHPSNTNAIFLIAGMYVVVFLGVAVKMVNLYNHNQLEIERLKSEKIEAELKFLKAQLHPHFLFNTLNNLYALTLERSDKAADVVLKLSALLDYVLYECEAELVPLEKEIAQIDNYLALEKLRFGSRLHIDDHLLENTANWKIPPMSLMTLLENSFKHSVSQSLVNTWMYICLEVVNGELHFTVRNPKIDNSRKKKSASGGIGLTNLANRLKLIYKENHRLHIDDSGTFFEVKLIIKSVENP
ncbi:MAG: histidine kinase [Cyclobacteriaceae bacterium]|nr:histidine kinase [Cyclobacteriaceae bacterium]